MKKYYLFALIPCFGNSLFAQTTGDAAVATAQSAQSNHWQNWAFAGIALVTAVGGILAVSLNNGQPNTSH